VFPPEDKGRLLSKHCECLQLVVMKKVLIHIHDVSGVEPLSKNTVLYTG
jgi:hypothetical protein